MKKRIPVLIYEELKKGDITSEIPFEKVSEMSIKWFNGVPYRVSLQNIDN